MKNTLPRLVRTAAALAAATVATTAAHAAGPLQKGQAPGFYRMMLGDFEVTALNDGTVGLPVDQLLQRTTPAQVKKALARNFMGLPTETSVNAYLVNTGAKLVLIDTGAAGLFGPTLGNLLANLQAAGYKPEQVDEVYITHMHPDHVGGLMTGDKPTFPNAVVRADKRDADFWLSAENLEKAPKEAKGFFQGAQVSLNPIVKAGRFQPFDGGTELVPGIQSVAGYGHTPGHAVYQVESKGQKLVLWGDLMHVGAVQFANPKVTIQFDVDQQKAYEARRKAFAEAAKAGHWVGATHLAFPGIGHLRAAAGGGYDFVPASYSIPR
jgi:glyoxylase-like metal-dependent hydrolase (beta-lactamase superfamily II)